MKEIQQTYVGSGNKGGLTPKNVRDYKVKAVLKPISAFFMVLGFVLFFNSLAFLIVAMHISVLQIVVIVAAACFLLFWVLQKTMYQSVTFSLDDEKLTIRSKEITEIWFKDISDYMIVRQNAVRLNLHLTTGKKIKLVSGIDSDSNEEMGKFASDFDKTMQGKITNSQIAAIRKPSFYEGRLALPFLIAFSVFAVGALIAVTLWGKKPAVGLYSSIAVLLSMWSGYFITKKNRQQKGQ